MEIYVGCCGVPGGLKSYSKIFKVTEINSSFYKLPKIKTAQRWRGEVPQDFQFTLKAFQGITHPITSPTWKRSGIKNLANLKNKVGFLRPTKEVLNFWDQTLEICKILNCPVCLIQLPSSFVENEENLENAKNFFSKIKRNGISIALELRGWSKDGFKKICKKFDLISCVDLFHSEPVWFSKKKIAYFRLHGSYESGKINYNYKYSKKDLLELRAKLNSLNVKKVFVLFNNTYMKENAELFLKLYN